jgi:hypothetical protein
MPILSEEPTVFIASEYDFYNLKLYEAVYSVRALNPFSQVYSEKKPT